MQKFLIALAALAALCLLDCNKHPTAASSALGTGQDAGQATTVTIENRTHEGVKVFVAFGSDSIVLPTSPGWSFCTASAKLNCSFDLHMDSEQRLPLEGAYFNATLSFQAPVTCNTTKIELNVNNPKWFNTADISLVVGFSNAVSVEYADTDASVTLGPVKAATGNEKAFGVFPLGCDICVARQNPPCGMSPGKEGCKTGPDQYHPDVICQYQGKTMSGASTTVKILYLGK